MKRMCAILVGMVVAGVLWAQSGSNPGSSSRAPSLSEVEQLFLANKISARQFQLYLQMYRLQNARPSTSTGEAQTRLHNLLQQLGDAAQPPPAVPSATVPGNTAPTPPPPAAAPVTPPATRPPQPLPPADTASLPKTTTGPSPKAADIVTTPVPAVPSTAPNSPPVAPTANVTASNTTPAPAPRFAAPVAPAPAPTDPLPLSNPEDPELSAAEMRLNELLRLKEARDRAEQIRAMKATNSLSGPATKRQRLDDLLRQNIEGKISDEDYKARRQAIIAEPEK